MLVPAAAYAGAYAVFALHKVACNIVYRIEHPLCIVGKARLHNAVAYAAAVYAQLVIAKPGNICAGPRNGFIQRKLTAQQLCGALSRHAYKAALPVSGLKQAGLKAGNLAYRPLFAVCVLELDAEIIAGAAFQGRAVIDDIGAGLAAYKAGIPHIALSYGYYVVHCAHHYAIGALPAVPSLLKGNKGKTRALRIHTQRIFKIFAF